VATGLILLGILFVSFFLLAKQFAIQEKLLPIGPNFAAYLKWMSLERAVSLGALLSALGLLGIAMAISRWETAGFGNLDVQHSLRLLAPSVTTFLAGVQIILTGFMFSILELKRTR
jgi:hypothetical protein